MVIKGILEEKVAQVLKRYKWYVDAAVKVQGMSYTESLWR